MNKITELLQQLADELGTTIQYLWGIELKEAFINGIGNLIIYIVVIIVGIVLYKLHKHLTLKRIYNWGDGYAVVMVIALIAWIIFVSICIFGGINDTMDSFFNPQYWALHNIMKGINQ